MWGDRGLRHGSSRSRFLDVDVNDFRVALAFHLLFQGYICNVFRVNGDSYRLIFFNPGTLAYPKNTLLMRVLASRRNSYSKTQAPSRPPRDSC